VQSANPIKPAYLQLLLDAGFVRFAVTTFNQHELIATEI